MKINEAIDKCVNEGGSDIFITTGSKTAIKINGEVGFYGEQIDHDSVNEAVKYLISEAEYKNFITNLEYDGAFQSGNKRFRVNLYFQKGEMAIVLRTINPTPPTFDELMLPEIIRGLPDKPQGLILVAGATGSGKSTTMAAMVNHINHTYKKHIITIEDPIEYVHTPIKSVISQREVGKDTKDFESAIKGALRQAPDVILLGEIRDKESLDMALKFAETGHLVMATIHANSAHQTFNRILSYYPPDIRESLLVQLSMNMVAILAQKLVKTIDGKRRCAVEVLTATSTIKELIARGEIRELVQIMEGSSYDEMITMDNALLQLWIDNIIDKEQALYHSASVANMELLISTEEAQNERNTEARKEKIEKLELH